MLSTRTARDSSRVDAAVSEGRGGVRFLGLVFGVSGNWSSRVPLVRAVVDVFSMP